MRSCLVWMVVLGCGGKSDPPVPAGSGSSTASGSAGSSPGSAALKPGSGSDVRPASSGSAVSRKLELKAGEKIREPLAEMPWQPPAGTMTVTLLDLGTTSRLVVWSADGKRHDVVNTKSACINNPHGADLTTGSKNTVVFRCEELGKREVFAEEWMIRWLDTKDFPTVYRHWRGARFQKDPRWAGGKLRYPEQAVGDNDSRECCCFWEDEDNGYERTSMRYCKGSDDHHGVCVDDAKCKADDE